MVDRPMVVALVQAREAVLARDRARVLVLVPVRAPGPARVLERVLAQERARALVLVSGPEQARALVAGLVAGRALEAGQVAGQEQALERARVLESRSLVPSPIPPTVPVTVAWMMTEMVRQSSSVIVMIAMPMRI